jgi:hypothetical protein
MNNLEDFIRMREKFVRYYATQRRAVITKNLSTEDFVMELQFLTDAEALMLGTLDAEIEALQSDRLIQHAQRLDLPLPSVTNPPMRDDNWYRDHKSGRRCLTVEGRHCLRAAIDAEEARRFEIKTLWVTKILLPAAGVVVAIIGALAGLIAILRHVK